MNISVVITTHERFELAIRAIKSVINQTYQPDEIILIEDASDSGVAEWISNNHPDIIYYRNQKNLGLAESRNEGIRVSQSKWIAFLDDDDEWFPNRLEEQVRCYASLNEVQQNNLACIQVGNKTINKLTGNISIRLPVNDGNLKESIKSNGARTPSSGFLFNKKALANVDGFDENLVSGIDHDIWMKLAVAGYCTKALKKPLVRIIEDAEETMMTNTEKRILGIQQYVNKWLPTYKEWFGEEKGDEYAREYFAKVIGRLAGQKIATGKFKDFYLSLKSIHQNVGYNFKIWKNTIIKVLKIFITTRYPWFYNFIKRKHKSKVSNF